MKSILKTAVDKVLEQDGIAAYKTSRGMYACQYRKDNLKCVAGQLIPDEDYTQMFESASSSAIRVLERYQPYLQRLQFIHDRAVVDSELDLEKFRKLFKERAGEYLDTI